MTDPHFHEEHVVERPATRRVVTTETRRSGGFGYGANPAALMVAAVLAVFIIVLILGFLL